MRPSPIGKVGVTHHELVTWAFDAQETTGELAEFLRRLIAVHRDLISAGQQIAKTAFYQNQYEVTVPHRDFDRLRAALAATDKI